MARPKSTRRTMHLHTKIYEDLYARALLILYSETHGRVPMGEWSKLFNGLLSDALDRAEAARPKQSPAQQENP